MKDVIGFLLFLIYASLIFFIKEYFLLGIVFAVNIILMIFLKINFKKTFIFILKIMPFIIFTAGLNILFSGVKFGFLIGLRLILVCNVTYIFSFKMTPRKLQDTIEKILTPLKIFKVNTKEIGIMISISIAFIPILQKEMQNLKYSLISKGFKLNLTNMIKRPNVIFMPLITSVIKKTTEIEQSMISKGYYSLN